MFIPMPGHPIPEGEASRKAAQQQVKALEKLVDEHDVIYLLMDSRESRWLPTVLGASKGKVAIHIKHFLRLFLKQQLDRDQRSIRF